MKLRIINESMTKLEQAAKSQIQSVLNKQGYPTYSRLLGLFDVNLTGNPKVIGYMEPGKAKIVLNKNLSIDQVSTIVRHEILHEYLTHAEREAKFKEKDPKYKNLPHDIMNIAGDYEISNVGYTDADKAITRSIMLNDKVLRGLVTEDDHPGWEDKSFEEMLELLYNEYKDNENALKQMMQRLGDKLDQAEEEAEQIERDAQIMSENSEGEESEQSGKISKAAGEAAEDIKDAKDKSESDGQVFDSDKEQKEKADLASKVEKIKKAFDDVRNKQDIDAEDREAIRKEKAAKQAKDYEKYKQSPIIKFKDSLNKFIKDQIATGRGKTWTRFSKKYASSGLIRPGTSRLAQSYVPLINVYFDRSGSWDSSKTEEGAKAISTLNKYVNHGQLKIKLYYFSNNVHSEEQDAINEGGTDGQPILDHIEATKPTNVIILTDSDIDDCYSDVTVPGGVWLLFYGGRSQNLIDHIKGRTVTKIIDMK